MFILVLLKPVLLNILFNSLLFIYLFLILFNIQNGGVLENGFEIFKCYKLSQVLSDFFFIKFTSRCMVCRGLSS